MIEKYLVSEKKMKKITPLQIRDAVEQAEMAFWSTVSDFIPQAMTTDVDPKVQKELYSAMAKAVDHWVKYNIVDDK